MKEELDIWFPNYKNNPGYVSKELKDQISTMIQHFDGQVINGRYEDFECFNLSLKLNNETYKDYITNEIHKKLGKFTDPHELQVGDTVLGRSFSPGKVGFGIFLDIGIRLENKQNDALLPLYQIREDLQLEELSTREIVKLLGLVDGYPIPVKIEALTTDPSIKIDVRLDDNFIGKMLDWGDEGRERLIITKTLQSSVSKQIKKLKLSKFIDRVESIDPLTTVIVCDKKTNASGLLPKLGARLNKSPIGIFHP